MIVYPGGWDLEGTLKEALKKTRGTLALEYQKLKKVPIVLTFLGLGIFLILSAQYLYRESHGLKISLKIMKL